MNRVFISYSRKNQNFAERLARDLGDAGLDVWIDLRQIHGGEFWQDEIFRGLERADFVVACLSPDAIASEWVQREINTAREQNKLVFPVMVVEAFADLNNSDTLNWLSDVQFVNFIDNYESAFPELLKALPGGRALSSYDDFDPDNIPNPFKGLEAFQQTDAPFFFGREELTRKALNRLRRAPFLAIVGASGSGKSSMVRAGIIPQIRSGVLDNSEHWAMIIFTPGAHPIEALARRLRPLLPVESEYTLATVLDDLRASGKVLTIVSEILQNISTESELLLVIDQFEEVFTRTSETERAQFLDVIRILATMGNSRTRIIITMRADFFGHLSHYPDLANLFEDDNLLIVTEMTTANLLRAIEGPAQAVGLRYEQGLVDAILDDVKSEPGSLPLLQYALRELYKRRDGAKLTLAAYQEIGGVQQALARHAESIFQQLKAVEQDLMRRLLLRLVEVSETGEATRRRVPRAEINLPDVGDTAIQHVLDLLSAPDARLLIVSRELLTPNEEPAVMLQVSHEALIREWERFQTWVGASLDDLKYEAELRKAAENWDTNKQDAAYLLFGKRLARAELWLEDKPITELQRHFIDASLKAQRQRQQQEEERLARELELQRAATQRLILLAGVLVIGIIAAIVFVLVQIRSNEELATANNQLEDAQNSILAERDRAEVNAEQARLLAISANARQVFLDDESDLALALISAAADTNNPPAAVQRTLADIALAPGTRWRVNLHGTASAIAYHPDNTRVAIGSNDGRITIVAVADGSALNSWTAHNGVISDLRFTPDGQTLISAALDERENLRLWDVMTGELQTELVGHSANVHGLTLLTDNDLLSVGDNFQAFIWDLSADPPTAEQPILMQSASVDISTVASNQRQEIFVLGGTGFVAMYRYDGRLIWSIPLRKQSDTVTALDFNRSGQQLIVGLQSGTMNILDVRNGEQLFSFSPLDTPIVSVRFLPDEQFFLVAGLDNTLRLWDIRLARQVSAFNADAPITSLGADSTGLTVVTGLRNNTLRLWELSNSAEIANINTFDRTSDLALTTATNLAAIGNAEGEANLIDMTSQETVANISIAQDVRLQTLAFSPDNNLLAVGDADGGITVTDWATNMVRYTVGNYGTSIEALIFSYDGARLIAATGDGQLIFITVESGVIERRVTGIGGAVTTLAFSADDAFLISGAIDGTLTLWNTETYEALRVFVGHTAQVTAVAMTVDSQRILSGSEDATVRLWDSRSGFELVRFEGHDDGISGIAFLPDEQGVLSASLDGTLRLWDIRAGEEIRRYEAISDTGRFIPIDSIALSDDGETAFATLHDSSLRAWRLFPTNESLLAWIRSNRFIPELDCNESLRFNTLTNPDFDWFGQQRFIRAEDNFVNLRSASAESAMSVSLQKDRASVRLLDENVVDGQRFWLVCAADGTQGWVNAEDFYR